MKQIKSLQSPALTDDLARKAPEARQSGFVRRCVIGRIEANYFLSPRFLILPSELGSISLHIYRPPTLRVQSESSE